MSRRPCRPPTGLSCCLCSPHGNIGRPTAVCRGTCGQENSDAVRAPPTRRHCSGQVARRPFRGAERGVASSPALRPASARSAASSGRTHLWPVAARGRELSGLGRTGRNTRSRPAIPTGRLILDALATMKIIPGRGQDPPVIPQPTPLQLRLLDLLGIDPRQLR
jgi:hypothetical protein